MKKERTPRLGVLFYLVIGLAFALWIFGFVFEFLRPQRKTAA